MNQTPVAVASQVRCEVAENPLWDANNNCLYWTDIPAGKIHRLDIFSGESRVIYQGKPVGGFTLQESGELLLFRVNDIAILRQNGDITVVRSFSHDKMQRFNDVIADPKGRVLAGTLGTSPECGVYRLDKDGSMTKLLSGTGCSNGMGFSPDLKTFYWTCSTRRTIFQFDYLPDSCRLENQRVFHSAAASEGIPDGLAVDADGRIWSARWGGAALVCHAPDGNIIGRIPVPVPNVTSVCFGGAQLNELFITSEQSESENAGVARLYHTKVDVKGRFEFRSQIKMH